MARTRPTPASKGRDVGAFEPIIQKALALSPRDRWRTVEEMLAALDGEPALPAVSVAVPAPTRRKRLAGALAIGAVVVVAAIVAARRGVAPTAVPPLGPTIAATTVTQSRSPPAPELTAIRVLPTPGALSPSVNGRLSPPRACPNGGGPAPQRQEAKTAHAPLPRVATHHGRPRAVRRHEVKVARFHGGGRASQKITHRHLVSGSSCRRQVERNACVVCPPSTWAMPPRCRRWDSPCCGESRPVALDRVHTSGRSSGCNVTKPSSTPNTNETRRCETRRSPGSTGSSGGCSKAYT